jgi:hypothetical protein
MKNVPAPRNVPDSWPVGSVVFWQSEWPHERHYAEVTGFLQDVPRPDPFVIPTECRVVARIIHTSSIHEAGKIVEWPTWNQRLQPGVDPWARGDGQ